jgi:hypothetical protein
MSFNPRDHFMLLKGKQYLPVAPRIAWFREEHPDWTITTDVSPSMSGADYVTFKATIADATGKTIATAHKTEHEKHFPDYREKAETGSIGRALALCGYGTLFAQELEEPVTPDGDIRIVDAPQESRKSSPVASKLAQPAPKPALVVLSPAEAMFAEMERIWGNSLTKDDKRGIHNVLIAGHPKAEIPVTKASMEEVTAILKACKTLAEGDKVVKESWNEPSTD